MFSVMSYYKNCVPFPGLFVYFQRTFLVSRAVEWSCLQYRASLPHPRLTMFESFYSNMSVGKISSLQRDFISETWINSLGNIKPGKKCPEDLSEPRYKLSSVVLNAEPASILQKNRKTNHMPFLRLQHGSDGHWGLLAADMQLHNGP